MNLFRLFKRKKKEEYVIRPCDITIDYLSVAGMINKKLCNILERHEIDNLEDLSNLTEAEFRKFRGVGDSSVKVVIDILEKYGLKFKEKD